MKITENKTKPQGDPKRWVGRKMLRGERARFYGSTKSEVQALLHDFEAKHYRQRMGLPMPIDTSITWGEIVERYLDQYPHSPQAKTTLEYRLKHSTDAFGTTRASDLTTETFQVWLKGLPGNSAASKAHIIKAVRQVFRWAIEAGRVARNPAEAAKAPKDVHDPADPFESWPEVHAVAAAIGDRYRPLVLFWAATGLRPQEIFALRYSDLRLHDDPPTVTVNRSVQAGRIAEGSAKTRGSLRTIPLSPLALQALAMLPEPLNRDQLVSPGAQGGIIDLAAFRRGSWRKALAAAGIRYRPPVQLRHTFATLSLTDGVPIESVTEMLGHSSITTTEQHYARFLPSGRKRIAHQLAAATPLYEWPEVASDTENEAGAQ